MSDAEYLQRVEVDRDMALDALRDLYRESGRLNPVARARERRRASAVLSRLPSCGRFTFVAGKGDSGSLVGDSGGPSS